MNLSEIVLDQLLIAFTAIPLLSFILSLMWKNHQEAPITRLVQITKIVYLVFAIAFALIWMLSDSGTLQFDFLDLYKTSDFVFALQFHYDYLSMVFSIVGALLFFMVTTFSKFYLHRDEGFKRFFTTILLFSFGFNLIVFSGNLETMFVGWEIIGLTSFLLIAFYRHRYLPVKNALKTLSNYRLSDLALILVMWMMHHLMHKNISFSELTTVAQKISLPENAITGYFIAGMIVAAAIIKSAQFPFTSWLPRSMEGPTSSTAIFYGSLSVHIGVFVLLRTAPIWEPLPIMKWSILIVGLITSLISTSISRIQTSVKTQIAYSSAAQIGLIFMEIALGWQTLALIHFTGNAFLRTYQLLVSPSVLNYLLHNQIFHYHAPTDKYPGKIKATIYSLGVKEWNMDMHMYRYVWSPFKWLGKRFVFLGNHPVILAIVLPSCLFIMRKLETADFITSPTITSFFFFVSFLFSLAAFAFRGKPTAAWKLLLLVHFSLIIGFAYLPDANQLDLLLYSGGIIVAFALGHLLLQNTEKKYHELSLNQYNGLGHKEKNKALGFLVCTIAMIGFPITTAFIGIDVAFTYVHQDETLKIILLTLVFILLELAAMRIYLRVYLGPYQEQHGSVAFRST